MERSSHDPTAQPDGSIQASDSPWRSVVISSAEPVIGVTVRRFANGRTADALDEVAVEEPFEIRIRGRSIAMIMRTPGADHFLTAGFLYSEGIVRSADDFRAVELAPDRDGFPQGNVLEVRLRPELEQSDQLWSRRFMTTASCGLCGKVSIESARARIDPTGDRTVITATTLLGLSEKLREAQIIFHRTGGLHAAGLFDAAGTMLSLHEDIGRHNAVDKVIGQMLLTDHLPLHGTILLVSGRASFELIQKAALAGISIFAAIGAPSSLAVELAEASRLTVVGMLRPGHFVIYSHPERIQYDSVVTPAQAEAVR